MKKEFSIRTMGGIPYSLDISNEDVTKMAIALSDSNIKIWNVPISKDAFSHLSSAGDLYRSENIWKGLKGKITKVSILVYDLCGSWKQKNNFSFPNNINIAQMAPRE
jgi:hypothetical protein